MTRWKRRLWVSTIAVALPGSFTLTWQRNSLLGGLEAYVVAARNLAATRVDGRVQIVLEAVDDERLDDQLPPLGFTVIPPTRVKRFGGVVAMGNLTAVWSGVGTEVPRVAKELCATLEDPPIAISLAEEATGLALRLGASNEAMTISGAELSSDEVHSTASAISRQVSSVGPVAVTPSSASD